MPLTGSLMFVYICIDIGDLVEGSVGMSLAGRLLFVYMLTNIRLPVNGIPTLPSAGSPTSIHI
jgi:hypothetical protein